jgi:hypothetical protein
VTAAWTICDSSRLSSERFVQRLDELSIGAAEALRSRMVWDLLELLDDGL